MGIIHSNSKYCYIYITYSKKFYSCTESFFFIVICNLGDQFRAFSDQLYRTPLCHKSVRNDVVNQVPDIFFIFYLSCDSSVWMNLLFGLVFVLQLRFHPEFYEAYVPMKYSDYVKKMSKYASDSPVYHLSHF